MLGIAPWIPTAVGAELLAFVGAMYDDLPNRQIKVRPEFDGFPPDPSSHQW